MTQPQPTNLVKQFMNAYDRLLALWQFTWHKRDSSSKNKHLQLFYPPSGHWRYQRWIYFFSLTLKEKKILIASQRHLFLRLKINTYQQIQISPWILMINWGLMNRSWCKHKCRECLWSLDDVYSAFRWQEQGCMLLPKWFLPVIVQVTLTGMTPFW